MDVKGFTERVNGADWQRFDDAEYFKFRFDGINSFAQTVPPTLIALALADKESDEQINMKSLKKQGISRADFIANYPIGSSVRFAIGNDHRGTYYPVIREALPFIIEVALYGNHAVARACAIDTLVDLHCFEPEVCGIDSKDDLDELLRFVRKSISDVVSAQRNSFMQFAVDDKRNKMLIEQLFSYCDKEG